MYMVCTRMSKEDAMSKIRTIAKINTFVIVPIVLFFYSKKS